MNLHAYQEQQQKEMMKKKQQNEEIRMAISHVKEDQVKEESS